jgi:mono/diheme cytochrome c family protein
MSNEWFSQMKHQGAVQAFEVNATVGAGQGLTPPEGAVPITDPYPNIGGMALVDQEALPNPVPASLESVRGGEALFRRYCTTCHGPEGRANGPVAGPPFGTGPFGVVIPIGGEFSLAGSFSDGHIYTTITMGRGRMPSYKRIPVNGRWDLINYIRVLNNPGDPQ